MISNQRKHTERKRTESSTSQLYYDDHNTLDHKMQSFIQTVESASSKNRAEQSRPLPYWAWYIIAKVNGVPLSPNEKPIFGTFVHALTFCCALAYLMSYIWYITYDIMSPNTPRDIPGGTVSIFLVVCWCVFGFYCKTLSSRLFFHRRFLKDVRLHSRTVFKINASILVVLLGSLFAGANIAESLYFLNWTHCSEIELDVLVCTVLTVSDIFFCILTLIWHSLVSFVFLSVCRTHTIGLRRFIKAIEKDAANHQQKSSNMFKNFFNAADDIWEEESLWLIENHENDTKEVQNSKNLKKEKSQYSPRQRREGEISILLSPVVETVEPSTPSASSEQNDWSAVYQNQVNNDSSQSHHIEIQANDGLVETMSQTEILHHYFKLNCRLRFSARALQRWFASFVALVLLRCSTYLVHWLGHTATVLDVLQFVLPLILLVVLSSAIAEVNFEGNRVWQCLYPTEDRVKMMQYLLMNPLVMPIYGFGMTHGTIVTVVFAILVGFVTRIIMTELTEMSQNPHQEKVISVSNFS